MISFVDTTLRCPSAGDDYALDQGREDGGGRTLTLHALRIDVKRLRYALEFNLPLLHANRARRALETLAAAQEQLGFINDLSQAGPRLLATAGSDPAQLAAVAQIAAHHMPRYRKIVDEAPKLLKRLERMPRPR